MPLYCVALVPAPDNVPDALSVPVPAFCTTPWAEIEAEPESEPLPVNIPTAVPEPDMLGITGNSSTSQGNLASR